jgi:hypothetical protein
MAILPYSVEAITDRRTADAYVAMAKSGRRPFMLTTDSATASGQVFLEGELEKRDTKVREPLASVTWPRDIFCKTGGGWSEYTSTMNVGYGLPDPNDQMGGGATNAVGIIEADVNKDVYRVFTKLYLMRIQYVDQAKFQQAMRSLDDILNKGVRMAWNKFLDANVYTGLSAEGTTGLVNDGNITSSAAATGAAGSILWSKKTPNEILADINDMINASWVASEYDPTGMINHILIPPANEAQLLTPVTFAGSASIMEYILKNNLYTHETGKPLTIVGSRWCIGSGAGNPATNQMVGYVNDEDRVYFDQTVPLTRIMTSPNTPTVSYDTVFAGQAGVVKFLYTQCGERRYGV